MAKTWDIFRKSTDPDKQPVATVHELEYHGEWMEDEYVIVTVKNPEPIDWKRGDNLTYRGEKFSVYYDPKVIKKARSGSYLEGFTYENVKLYSEAARLKDINFNDIVLADNMIPYTSLNSFSFFAETVEDLADRIQANLDRMEPGEWNVYTPDSSRTGQRLGSDQSRTANWSRYYDSSETVGKTDVNVTAEGLKCWDALKLSYTAFDVSYFVTGRTIVIGGKAILAGQKMDGSSESDGHDFRYGKGMGLYEIERTTNEDSKVVTKLFAYGSEKNVPLGYYANLGKRILIPICQKTQREILQGNPDLILWVNKSWLSVKNAFNSNYEVKLSCNGHTAVFFVSNHTYTYADEAQDNTLDHETEYLTFYALSSHEDALAFYNGISAGMSVYVLSGANINKMPSEFIQLPQDYNYTAALSINKLMLPGFPQKDLFSWVVEHGATNINIAKKMATWHGYRAIFSTDKQDPYIISPNFEKEGLCEGSVTFDESSGQEICPTIEGTGLDEVLWAEQMDDNGYLGESPKAGETTFGFMSKSLFNDDGSLRYEIDWSDNDGEVVITMKDGACVGREFKMKKAKRNDNGDFELTLERYYDSSIGRYFPYREQGSNTLYQVFGSGNSHGTQQGNHFIATGIHLPDSYVELAAEKLLEEALKHLAGVDHQNYTYIPKVDEIYMQRQDDFTTSEHSDEDERIDEYGTVSLHETLHAGMQMEIEDDDLDVHYKPFIDVLTIKENGNNGIPTYDVVLRDAKEMTLQERIQSQIDGGKSGVLNITGGDGVSESDIEAIGDGLFLSKTHDDETEYLISLFGGAVVDMMLRSPDFLRGLWTEDTDANTGETVLSNDGKGFAVTKDAGGKWSIEIDEAIVRSLIRTKELMANEAAIDKMTKQTLFKLGLKTLGDIILGDYEEGKSGGVLTPEGNAELRSLVARLQATIGSGLYPDEDNPDLRKPSLTVNGDSEFSHNLSSQEFISGFFSGKGWAIQRNVYENSAGMEETKWSMEIDNLTVRNILRVYELVVSQLRGENDNYVFAAMAEVDHYDPVSGRVWISTEGGKIYNPFRVGDYIMVQRFQPGNDVVSGGDGYITKQYELIILAVGSGGENDPKDANGDRLDWVLFKNFTSQMLTWDFVSSNYSEEELASTIDRINRDYPNATQARKRDLIVEALKIPDMMIRKGDTFCRVDNETDPERKGLMTITSVGPNTPYMDVIYGMKTDPDHSLKSRLGNLEGVKTDLFGWLEGFGAYINNLYGVGKFFNAQTGEAMESRIEATNERMRSVYKETTFDITDADNKVSNGFFQDDLDGWTPVKVSDNGTVTADDDGPEMNYSNSTQKWSMSNTDQNNQIAVASGESTTVDGQEYQLPLLMNGLQMEIQKTLKSEISEVGGMKVLHLAKSGVIQNFSLMDENTSHKKLSVDDEDFEAADVQMVTNKEYEKTSYAYWEQYYRDWLFENWERLYPGVTYEKCKVDEIITSQTAVTWINNQVAIWSASYSNNYDNLTSTEADPDKLYLGIRIMPLTDGWLRIGFLTESGKFDQYQNATQCFSKYFSGAGSTMKWEVATWNDDPTDGTFWYFPCDSDKVTKRGRLLISYTGECYIRFVVLSNDPIEESEHEYETLIEQNARRIRMQAKKDEKEFAEIVIQHNAIVQSITDNRDVADHALKDILGIEYNEKTGMYTFPNDWFDPSYTYGSWLIHTKSRIDFLFTKFDDKGNLIGYSNHTQTADYISDIIASGDGYPTWAVNCMNFAKAFLRFSNTYYENSNLKYGVWLTAIADSALSSSELTTIKALFQSNGDIQQKYTAAANKVSEIPSDIGDLGDDKKISDPMGRSLIVTFFNRVVATRYSTVKSSVNSLSADGGSNVNMNNSTFLSLRNMEIPQMEEACRELVAMIVNRYGEQKLGANIQIVQERFKAYQDRLDDAIKDAYEGQNVDFVSWASDTALSSVQAKAILDKETGKILTESIKTQTAELIQNAINDYGDEKFSDYTQTANGFQSLVVCLKNDRINFANFETAQGNVRSYLEDNILNKSEYEAIKKLRMSLVTEYTDITATYTQIHGNSSLPGDDNNQGSVKGKIKKAYDDLSGAYTTLLSSIDTLIADYDSALQTNTSGNIEIKVSDTKKNAVNNDFAKFNTKLTDYQKAIDEASNEINKATAQGLVNQLKAIINKDVLADDQGNYAYAGFTQTEANRLANIFGKWEVDSNGNPTYLKGYSTTQQTADMISASVISQNRKTVSLADTSVWEQGSTDGESAGKTYEQVKITSNNRIRTKSLIPVTKDTVIELTGSSFMVGFVCFGLDMKISSDAWKGWYSYNSANLTLKNTISDSTKYVAILLRYTNSASISASNVTSSGIKLTNTEVISSSEVQQTAENITTTVTNNKTAAETAFKTLFEDSSFSLDGSNIASKVSASWIMHNKSGISFAAAEFDSSGNLKSSGKIKVAVDGVLTTVKNYKTGGYSILTQTANAIKAVVDEDYIEDLGFATSDDLSSYYTKEELKIGGNAITSVVQGLQEKTVSIAEWEQDGENTIKTTSHIPVSSTSKFYLNSGYTIYIGFYNASDTFISGVTTAPDSYNRVSVTIPDNATLCFIKITRIGGISPKQISATGFRMTDTTIVTSAEISSFVKWVDDGNGGKKLESGIKLSADQITQVANNITIDANKINWKVTGGWTISNGTITTLSMDASGNLTIAGKLTQGTITGNVTIGEGTNKMQIVPSGNNGAALIGKKGSTEVINLGFEDAGGSTQSFGVLKLGYGTFTSEIHSHWMGVREFQSDNDDTQSTLYSDHLEIYRYGVNRSYIGMWKANGKIRIQGSWLTKTEIDAMAGGSGAVYVENGYVKVKS